jgi:hypothetical protein
MSKGVREPNAMRAGNRRNLKSGSDIRENPAAGGHAAICHRNAASIRHGAALSIRQRKRGARASQRKEAMMVRFSLLCAALFLAASVLLGAAAIPAYADKPLTNLGPVGPGEPLIVAIGDQRIIAFYTPARGECAVNAVVWKDADTDPASTRVRLSLKPGQTLQLDGAQRKAMSLLCGADAATLTVVAPAELLLTGVAGSN